jgi:catechol 2,3-dioxygenase-like lactoylglutathione lyase family enzyme
VTDSIQPLEQTIVAGAHVIVYGRDPDAARAFFRDVLGFTSADAGGGWLIFALPPAELAVHPIDADEGQIELYLRQDEGRTRVHANVVLADLAPMHFGQQPGRTRPRRTGPRDTNCDANRRPRRQSQCGFATRAAAESQGARSFGRVGHPFDPWVPGSSPGRLTAA